MTKIEVAILSLSRLLYEGEASQVNLPGEYGEFEVGPYHKPLVSRLLSGIILVDSNRLPIRRGVVKVAHNRVIALVEPI